MKNIDIEEHEDDIKSILTVSEDDKDRPRYDLEPKGQSLRELMELTNIAEKLSEDDLSKIGEEAKRGYDYDLESRVQWERDNDEWMRLATQVREPKNYPWPRSSNVKYPLLTTAAMQFAARAYPSLVPSNGQVVKSQVIGKDPDGSKLELATRVNTFMSYQLMKEMKGWEEDMDKLLIMLPVSGTVFKKTYWDPVTQQNVSKLILPKNLVVNYWTECLETSERISERIEMSPRVMEERKRAKLFLNEDLGTPNTPIIPTYLKGGQAAFHPASNDETTPYVIIEQHTFLDLDNDGYKEPYVVTFDYDSGEVLRITARFDDSTMHFNAKDELLKIDPLQYYTKFGFIPNPDGSFYDLGFGMLLGPINESVNSLINQLVDAGTLSNLQGGFLGKGLRLKMGEQRFLPGEWKPVNATGDDLKKQIVPLPAKDPSDVLFKLMGSLITSGKELASVAEIFTGKMPGQNTPATTTMATVEQGMKVFTAVYKRLYRALDEEFKKLFNLNATYLNPETYQEVTGITTGPEDFQVKNAYRICPGADPTAVSQTEKLMKAQGLMELLPLGTLDPIEVTKRILDAQEQPNWEQILNKQIAQTGEMPPPPPDPKLQEMQMTGQLKQAELQMKGDAMQRQSEIKSRDAQQQAAMKQQNHAIEMQAAQDKLQIERAGALHKQRIFSAEGQQKLIQSQLEGRQKLQMKQSEHQMKLKQQAAKPKPQGSTKK
jgi:chaperonin GroES